MEDPAFLHVRLYMRWYRLRKTRPDLVPALLQEPHSTGFSLWTFDNPMDPWGSRIRLSLAELERIVTEAELVAARKPVAAAEAERAEVVRCG